MLVALAGDGCTADTHVDHSIAPEYHARRRRCVIEMNFRLKKLPHVGKAVAFEAASRQSSAEHFGLGLRVGEIHQTVGRKLRMKGDVHQARQSCITYFGNTRNRLCIQNAVTAFTNDAQIARTLRDQNAAVRQKRHAPRMRQSLRDNNRPQLVLFGSIEDERSRSKRRHRRADRCLLADCHRQSSQQQNRGCDHRALHEETP